MFDATQAPIAATTFALTGMNNADGNDEYTFTFYHLPGTGYTYAVEVLIDGVATMPTPIEISNSCTQCIEAPAPENVPTVGEWGLIMLGLLMSITAIVGIRARREEEAIA